MLTPAVVVRLALVVGLLLVRLPTLTEPQWFSDDGTFTVVGMQIAAGKPLYAAVYDNSPPGIYWLYRVMLAQGLREHHFVVQVAATIAVVASALLTFEIACRLLPRWVAATAAAVCGLVLSIPTLGGDLLNVELAGLPFFLGAIALALVGRDSAVAGAGFMLGVALVFRPSFAVDALTLLYPLAVLGCSSPWVAPLRCCFSRARGQRMSTSCCHPTMRTWSIRTAAVSGPFICGSR